MTVSQVPAGEPDHISVNTVTNLDEIEHIDVVILAVKNYDLQDAAKEISKC